MTDNPKYFVLEWDKSKTNGEEYDLKVTPHQDSNTALEQAKTSNAEVHCISTINPLETNQGGNDG